MTIGKTILCILLMLPIAASAFGAYVYAAYQRYSAAALEIADNIYPGLNHSDIIMAISRPFREKGPVLDDSIAFLAKHGIASPADE